MRWPVRILRVLVRPQFLTVRVRQLHGKLTEEVDGAVVWRSRVNPGSFHEDTDAMASEPGMKRNSMSMSPTTRRVSLCDAKRRSGARAPMCAVGVQPERAQMLACIQRGVASVKHMDGGHSPSGADDACGFPLPVDAASNMTDESQRQQRKKEQRAVRAANKLQAGARMANARKAFSAQKRS